MQVQDSGEWATFVQQLETIVAEGHWLGDYIKDLVNACDSLDGISFEHAHALLTQTRQLLEEDLAVARRMYRLYPQLVTQGEEQLSDQAGGV